MIGLLVALIGLAGLALGMLGRSLLPFFASSAVAGLVLVSTALVHVFRSRKQRQIIPLRVAATLASGLALLDLPLAFWFLLEAGLSHSAASHSLLPLKILLSFTLVVFVPTSVLLLVRIHQLNVAHGFSRVRPAPILWGFRRGGPTFVGAATVLLLLGLLLPLYGGWPPILLAIRCHSAPLTRLCLVLGTDVNWTSRQGWTPLSAAVEESDPALVALLLDRGADPNGRGSDMPPLTVAVMRGRPEVVKILLRKGADPNISSVFGPPLCAAARRGYAEIVSLLLAHGTDPGQECSWGCTAIESALGYPIVLELLLKGGVDPNLPCNEQNPWILGDRVTPLMIAAAGGFDPAVRALLAGGADPSLRSAKGNTALALAAEHGRTKIVRLLREKGAN